MACKPGFFLHVRVLSRLFRRLLIEGLIALHSSGQLAFFGKMSGLADAKAFAAWLAPFRKTEWVVYAKPPFGGPEAVMTYLSRYTHWAAISNRRLISADAETVAFRWKDYRIKRGELALGHAARNRCRARRHGSRPHDPTPVHHIDKPLAVPASPVSTLCARGLRPQHEGRRATLITGSSAGHAHPQD